MSEQAPFDPRFPQQPAADEDADAGRPRAPAYGPGSSHGYGYEYGYQAGYGLQPQPEEMHVLDFVRIVYRRRWMALTALLLVLVTVAGYTSTLTRVYAGRAQLLIDPESQNVISVRDVTERDRYGYGDPDYYQTQYKILQSRRLALKAVTALNLADSPEFGGGKSQDRKTQGLSFGVRRAVSATLAWAKGLVGWQNPGPKEAPLPSETARQSSLIDAFLGHLAISPIRNSRLVDVTFESADPNMAARGANALADAYIQQSLEFRFSASKAATDWLSEQLAQQRKRVEDSELALQKYREEGNAVALDDRQNIVVQRFAELNAALTRARTNRIEKEAQYNRLLALENDRGNMDSVPAILQNAFIQQLKGQLAELQQTEVQLAEKVKDKHPEMIKIKSAIASTEARLRGEIGKVAESMKNEFLAAREQEQRLTAALESEKGQVLALNRSSITYGVLRREAESNQQIYNSLMQQAKETGVSAELRTSNIHVVDYAEVPRSPVRPDFRMNLMLGLLAGCVLGAGVAFFFEYMDKRIKSPEEIKALGLPFLGLIPKIATAKLSHDAPALNNGVPARFREACRVVRTSVLFSMTETGPCSLVVTSTGPGEGKTQVAASLAMGLAQTGQRVLLVDADMRRARLHEILQVARAPGVSDLVTGQSKVSDSVRETSFANLWLLPAGSNPPNPAELLGSKRFGNLLAAMVKHFDWVILDTPPVMAVTDATLLSHRVTGVLFVVGCEMTDRNAAAEALERLAGARAKLIGGVLNRVNIDRHSYYYSRHYRRDYSDYYRDQTKEEQATQ